MSRIRGQELLNEILVHLIWLQILQLIRNQTLFQEKTVPVAGGKDWKGINPIISVTSSSGISLDLVIFHIGFRNSILKIPLEKFRKF